MDMKKILQALDTASSKPVEGSNDMKKFLQVVKEADLNQPATAPTAPTAPGADKDKNPLQDPNFPKYAELMNMYDMMSKEFSSDPNTLGIIKSASPSFVQEVEKLKTAALKLAGANGPLWDKARQATGDMSSTQLATQLEESKSPHKVALPVQMAMQHYQAPKKEKLEEVSVFKTYMTVVEEDFTEKQIERQTLIKQYGQRIAEAVNRKNGIISERVTFNADGTRTPSFADQMKANGAQPSPEPAQPAVIPLGKRFDPRFKNGPEPYTIDIDGQIYKFAGRDKQGPGTGEVIKVPAAVIGIRGLGAVSVELGKDGMYYPAAQTNENKNTEPPKPRNFVAKNAKMGGAGQHKDKKKAEKQGDVKHKKPHYESIDSLEEMLQSISKPRK